MRSQKYLVTSRLSGLAIAGALLLGNAAPAAAIGCSTNSTVKNPFYPGKASSDVYDNRFKESHRIPFLPEHVPQGLATWSNWPRGRPGDDLLLITSYDPEKRYSLIIGVDAKTGKQIGAARIKYTHGGGIAVCEKFGKKLGWAFVSDDDAKKVRKYSLKKLADAIFTSNKKILDSDGPDQTIVGGSSFLTSHGPTSTLWAGEFKLSAKSGTPHMTSYKVDANGKLSHQNGIWEVPIKTQGVAVTKDFFIYSTSHDRNKRSNLYVVRRGKGETDLDKARLFCFRSPSMSEGIAVYGDNLYVAYESGATKFNPPERPPSLAEPPDLQHQHQSGVDRPRNIIKNLHRAKLASLEELPPRSGPTRPGAIAPDKGRHKPVAP